MKETSSNELRDAKPILDVCCGGRMFYADEDLGRHWNELNSKQIKVLLFSYFRFKRQFLGVVSEMQLLKDIDDIEDFIAFKKDEIIGVEIKVSRSDFLADFNNKKKHKKYLTQDYLYPLNKFYFCVPILLSDFVEDFLSKNYPFYGLLVVRGNEIFVKRSAKRLRGKQDIFSNKSLRDKLILRMSSELANLRSEALN